MNHRDNKKQDKHCTCRAGKLACQTCRYYQGLKTQIEKLRGFYAKHREQMNDLAPSKPLPRPETNDLDEIFERIKEERSRRIKDWVY